MVPTLQFYEYQPNDEQPFLSLPEEEIHIWYLGSALTYEPILCALLGAYRHLSADEICLKRTEHGKPYWQAPAGCDQIYFNVSHSGDWTLLAFCPSYSLGIDLQQRKPLSRKEAIAARMFHPRERQAYEALSGPEQDERFYRLWTIKEACLKRIGTGLSSRADYFYVNLSNPAENGTFIPVHTEPKTENVWDVCTLPCPSGYAASLAILSPDQTSTIHPSGASIRPI